MDAHGTFAKQHEFILFVYRNRSFGLETNINYLLFQSIKTIESKVLYNKQIYLNFLSVHECATRH